MRLKWIMYLSPQVLSCYAMLTMNTSTSFNWFKLTIKISFKNIKFCLVYFFWHFCYLHAGCFLVEHLRDTNIKRQVHQIVVSFDCIWHIENEWHSWKKDEDRCCKCSVLLPKVASRGHTCTPTKLTLGFSVSSFPCTVRLLCKCLTRSQQLICLYLVTYTE